MLYIIGHYAGGVFKFNVIFSEQYPQDPPTVNFITPVFHPLIRADGLLNVEAGFPQWRSSDHHVHHILFWMSSSFSDEGLDKVAKVYAWNKEAYRLYQESKSQFVSLATQSVTLSKSAPVLESGGQTAIGSDPYHKGIALPTLDIDEREGMTKTLSLIDWEKSFG